MGTRTITMSNHPPVTIDESTWSEVASASWHDGKLESQANRRAWLKVRRHTDGRSLVYGGYTTQFQGERDERAGVLVPAADYPAGVISAIKSVAFDIGMHEIGLGRDCIADLPAEVL